MKKRSVAQELSKSEELDLNHSSALSVDKGMNMTCEQKNEVNALIEECRDMGFRSSSEVSHYITKNKLGYKYQHISGYLTMSDGRGEWEFEGGIAPQFYAYICKKLELSF